MQRFKLIQLSRSLERWRIYKCAVIRARIAQAIMQHMAVRPWAGNRCQITHNGSSSAKSRCPLAATEQYTIRIQTSITPSLKFCASAIGDTCHLQGTISVS